MVRPVDVQAGGTWIGVSEPGVFACITNLSRLGSEEDRPSRGRLIPEALKQGDAHSAVESVRAELARRDFNPGQLVIADLERAFCIRWHGSVNVQELDEGAWLFTNLDEFHAPTIRVDAPQTDVATAKTWLRDVLRSTSPGLAGHVFCKLGGSYGTTSSSIVHMSGPGHVAWEFAHGPPTDAAYRSVNV